MKAHRKVNLDRTDCFRLYTLHGVVLCAYHYVKGEAELLKEKEGIGRITLDGSLLLQACEVEVHSFGNFIVVIYL